MSLRGKGMSFRRTLRTTTIAVLLSAGLVFILFPVLWAVLSSFKGPQEILKVPPSFLPESFRNFENYAEVFSG